MALAVAFLTALAFYQGGLPLFLAGATAGAKTFLNVIPMLLAAFAVSGLIQVLINPEKVSRLLGKNAGIKGIFLAALTGALLPGGPYVYYPIAASFASAGAEASTIMAFIAAKSLWDLARIPMEAAILGGKLTAVRLLVTSIFPIIIGFLARWLYPGLTEHLRSAKGKEEAAQ